MVRPIASALARVVATIADHALVALLHVVAHAAVVSRYIAALAAPGLLPLRGEVGRGELVVGERDAPLDEQVAARDEHQLLVVVRDGNRTSPPYDRAYGREPLGLVVGDDRRREAVCTAWWRTRRTSRDRSTPCRDRATGRAPRVERTT